MKAPFSWLKDYVDIDITAQELAEKLFSCGFEVEELSYLGENCFIAEMCENSKLQVGDTFSCSQFVLGQTLVMSDLRQEDSARSQAYVVGRKNGLTILKKL